MCGSLISKREIRKTDCYNYNCYNTIFGFKTTKQIVVSFFISSTFPVVLKFSRSKHSIFEQDKNKERITSINTFFHHILSFHFPKVSYITQFLPLINFFFSSPFHRLCNSFNDRNVTFPCPTTYQQKQCKQHYNFFDRQH